MVAATGCKKKPAGETNVTVTTDGTNPDALAMGDTDLDVSLDGNESVEGNGSSETPAATGGSTPGETPGERPATQQRAQGSSPNQSAPTQATPPAQTNSNSSTQSNASTPAGTYTAQVSDEFKKMMQEGMRQQAGAQMNEEMMKQAMAMIEQQIASMRLTLNPGGDFIMNLGIAGEVKGNWTLSGDNVSMVAKTFTDRSSGTATEQQMPPDQQQAQVAKWNKSAGTLTVDQDGMSLTFKKV